MRFLFSFFSCPFEIHCSPVPSGTLFSFLLFCFAPGFHCVHSLQHLDTQKDEAIMRTFRGVAKNFRSVFSELVPSGKGSIILRSRADADARDKSNNADGSEDEDEVESDDESAQDVSMYTGVAVKVRGIIPMYEY